MPVSSSSIRMPSCDTASIMLFCSATGREERVLRLRPERAEHRRPEQEAGEQLAHDRGLTDPLHGLAHEPPDKKQDNDLGEEDHLRGARSPRDLCSESARSG